MQISRSHERSVNVMAMRTDTIRSGTWLTAAVDIDVDTCLPSGKLEDVTQLSRNRLVARCTVRRLFHTAAAAGAGGGRSVGVAENRTNSVLWDATLKK